MIMAASKLLFQNATVLDWLPFPESLLVWSEHACMDGRFMPSAIFSTPVIVHRAVGLRVTRLFLTDSARVCLSAWCRGLGVSSQECYKAVRRPKRAGSIISFWFSYSNVTGQDRPTGCKNSDCSERRPSHNGSLWVVAWTRLFDAILFRKCQKRPENGRFRACRPFWRHFFIILPSRRLLAVRLALSSSFSSPWSRPGIYLLFLLSNVTGQDRPTGCKNSDCSERKPSHNGSLWVVAWTRLNLLKAPFR